MRVKDIDYIDIEEFLIAEIQRLNLKKKALGNLFGYLKNVFAYAMRKRIIRSSPCDLVDLYSPIAGQLPHLPAVPYEGRSR